MATSFGALCTDFYINHKLALKMDLPSERETILHFFDRMRKSLPAMNRFKRYDGELALESARKDARYTWLALRRNSIRTGHVNPETMDQALDYHKLVLELAPYHLTISPLDVDYVELMYGFDLECKQNHDAVVFEALYADSPLGSLLGDAPDKVLDVQPVFGQALNDAGDLQAYYEVKTRPRSRRGSSKRYSGEPISLFLTLRQYGPVEDLGDMPKLIHALNAHGERLATDKLIPDLLTPIVQHIGSSA
ncbi:MAG: hypothetical protein AAFX76_01825 [Planctomycetota bacterium]